MRYNNVCYLKLSKKVVATHGWGKTTISNAGILKQVFQKPLGAPGRVRVLPGPPAGLG